MECTCEFLIWSVVFTVCFVLLLLRVIRKNGSKKHPPGPRGWPVIGNMLDLGTIPHQTLYTLQFKYGPVLWLKLGSLNTMVVQSAQAASVFFKNHDANFSDRKCPEAITAINYNQSAVAFVHCGAYWRFIRRLASTELLNNRKMNESAHIRMKCVNSMINFIQEESTTARAKGESGEVTLAHYLFLMAFNLIGNLMLSRDLLDPRSKEGREFFEATIEITKCAGKPNVADFFPVLKRLDPQRIKRNMEQGMHQITEILEGFIKQKIEEQKLGKERENKDFMDVLLEHEGDGPDNISDHNMKIVVLEMFLAGSETTSSTLEWGMAEVLRHPDCMRKVKEELDRVVGPNRNVEEGDLDNLLYLQTVVKETLRLHPTIPLLLPRNASQDTIYMGYHVPKDTQVFINAWAIGRDPDEWEDPLSFKPERFLGSDINYKGQNFELIPFGSGRRICMGLPLAHTVVPLVLASLLHYFDWELGSNVTPETIDMNERSGITLRMLTQLKAIPRMKV